MSDNTAVIRWLGNIQNVSAIIGATFLGVHLAAPLAAAVGGEHAATQTMMVGRVWYQGLPNELVIVYGALTTHMTIATIRRGVIAYKSRRFPRFDLHQIAGHILIPIVAIHALTNRVVPALDSKPPINNLSPSELDYTFAGYGLKRWPIANWTIYGLLITCGSWHVLAGSRKLLAWIQGKRRAADTARIPGGRSGFEGDDKPVVTLKTAWVVLVSVLFVGLIRIQMDSEGISAFTAKRYEAVYKAIPLLYP